MASITAGSEVAKSPRFTKGESESSPDHLAYWSSIVSGRIDQNQCLPIRNFPTCSAHVSESDVITARRSRRILCRQRILRYLRQYEGERKFQKRKVTRKRHPYKTHLVSIESLIPNGG